jgi:hypothetical protein
MAQSRPSTCPSCGVPLERRVVDAVTLQTYSHTSACEIGRVVINGRDYECARCDAKIGPVAGFPTTLLDCPFCFAGAVSAAAR